jgi:hypothetical protein
MQLERLHTSKFPHDSLGENVFYYQFGEQMSARLFYDLINYFLIEAQITNYQRPILNILRKE